VNSLRRSTALLLVLFGLSIPGRLLSAGTAADVPPPAPPFVAPVPESADWVLTVKPPAQPSPGGSAGGHPEWRIQEVHSTVSGNRKRDVITYGNGTKAERWFMDNLLFWKSADGSVIANNLSSNSADPAMVANTPSIGAGFFGTDWLKLPFYDGVVAVEKRPCYHFVHQNKEAWIDVKTKLPVACKLGGVVYLFAFNAPPSDGLILPPEFKKAWEDYQAMLNRGKAFQQSIKAGQSH